MASRRGHGTAPSDLSGAATAAAAAAPTAASISSPASRRGRRPGPKSLSQQHRPPSVGSRVPRARSAKAQSKSQSHPKVQIPLQDRQRAEEHVFKEKNGAKEAPTKDDDDDEEVQIKTVSVTDKVNGLTSPSQPNPHLERSVERVEGIITDLCRGDSAPDSASASSDTKGELQPPQEEEEVIRFGQAAPPLSSVNIPAAEAVINSPGGPAAGKKTVSLNETSELLLRIPKEVDTVARLSDHRPSPSGDEISEGTGREEEDNPSSDNMEKLVLEEEEGSPSSSSQPPVPTLGSEKQPAKEKVQKPEPKSSFSAENSEAPVLGSVDNLSAVLPEKKNEAASDRDSVSERPPSSVGSNDSSEERSPVVTKSGRKSYKPQEIQLGSSPNSVEIKTEQLEEEVGMEVDLHQGDDILDVYAQENPEVWTAGALVWARQGSASPYWPSLISLDPDFGIISRIQIRGVYPQREYHVQFFGKVVLRGWVSSTWIMEYKGLEDFQKTYEELKGARGKKSQTKLKQLKAFLKPGKNKEWDEAVKAASEMIPKSSADRQSSMNSLFVETALAPRPATPSASKQQQQGEDDGSKRNPVGRPRSSKTSPSEEPPPAKKPRGRPRIHPIKVEPAAGEEEKDRSQRKRKRESEDEGAGEDSAILEEKNPKKIKLDAIEELIQNIPPEILDEHRRKLKTGYKLFQLANYNLVTELLGGKDEASEKSIERKLNHTWQKVLSYNERKVYKEQALRLNSQDEESSAPSEVGSEAMPETPMVPDDDTASVASSCHTTTDSPSTSAGPAALSTRARPLNSVIEMVGQFKKESFCIICEELSFTTGDLVKCRGICGNAFHFKCLGLEPLVGEAVIGWKCEDCTKGQQPCFICKKYNTPITKCNANQCHKFYHQECLKDSGLWPQARFSEKAMTCPAHICHTCASEDPSEPFMKYNSKLLRCIRCPTSYHSGDANCVTAGSVQFTSTSIICPKHYRPKVNKSSKKKGKYSQNHINATWCFICSEGGTLICCEKCPHAFHKDCLKIENVPDVYHCDHCETGRMPLYGEIVWVKLGIYRWWPAKVIPPTELPDKIERLPHQMGEFPILFCGTTDYCWINQGRVFLYDADDANRIPCADPSATGINNSYKRGLAEAAILFEEYTTEKKRREAANADKVRMQGGSKPPLFTKIKTNRPIGDCIIYTEDPEEHQICECDPDKEAPCGPDSECLNRLLMTECKPSTCKAKEKCLNQQFQRRQYPPVQVARTNGRGWGLFVKAPLKKGAFIIEYVGELISMEEFHRRINDTMRKNEEMNYYYMTMDSNRMIDAAPKGNVSRFMNHSCAPNCETQKWTVNGDTRVGLFTTEDIPANTELTFNYQLETVGDVKKRCLCGAPNCSGWIGEKPSSNFKDGQNSDAGETGSSRTPMGGGAGTNGNPGTGRGRKTKKMKLKKSKVPEKQWEDLCFRCFDGGELLMCNFKTCPKVYHLACLDRDKNPRGEWFCPWHHCVTCGKPAVSHCMHCPNAYCKTHNSVLGTHPYLQNICDEHDDLNDAIAFYKNLGGIGHLVPNPNVVFQPVPPSPSPSPTPFQEEEDMEEESASESLSSSRIVINSTTSKTQSKINAKTPPSVSTEGNPAASLTPPGSNVKALCKCIELECNWIGLKSKLFDHLIQMHNMPIPYSKEKANAVLGALGTANSPKKQAVAATPSPKISSTPSSAAKTRMRYCPVASCGLTLRSDLFLQHIESKHPDFDQSEAELALEDPDTLVPEQDRMPLPPSSKKRRRLMKLEEHAIRYEQPGNREAIWQCKYCPQEMRGSNVIKHVNMKHPDSAAEAANRAPPTDTDEEEDNGAEFARPPPRHDRREIEDHATMVPARLDTVNGSEVLYKCKYCSRQMRGSGFWKHMKSKHPGGLIAVTPPKVKVVSTQRARGSLSGGSGAKDMADCPECGITIRASNFYRHWRRRHWQIPVPELAFRASQSVPPGTMLEPYNTYNKTDSARSSSTLDLDFYDDDDDDTGDNSASEVEEEDYVCGFPECKHVAMSKNELANHRRKFGHPKQRRSSVEEDDNEEEEEEIHVNNLSRSPTKTARSRASGGIVGNTCDEPGCGYSSTFRGNLVRHCRRTMHFSEHLLRTSKVRPDYMNIPEGFELGQAKGGKLSEAAAVVQREDQIKSEGEESESEEVTPQYSETNGGGGDLMEEPEDEVVQESFRKENLNKFCNFDITGLLDESDNEEESGQEEAGAGDLKLNFKVL